MSTWWGAVAYYTFHLTYFNTWRGGPLGRRTNRPTWQLPGSQAAQSANVCSPTSLYAKKIRRIPLFKRTICCELQIYSQRALAISPATCWRYGELILVSISIFFRHKCIQLAIERLRVQPRYFCFDAATLDNNSAKTFIHNTLHARRPSGGQPQQIKYSLRA